MFKRIYEANEIRFAIQCYDKFKSYRKTAIYTGISKSSIQRWYSRFHSIMKIHNKIQKRKRRVVHQKKYPNIIEDIKSLFSKQKLSLRYISLQEIANDLSYEKQPSLSWICKLLKSNKISRRRFQKMYHVRGNNCSSFKQKENIFFTAMNNIKNSEICCIDETGFCNIGNAYYGYFEKGKLPENINVSKRDKRSVVLAICVDGLVEFSIQKESFNTSCYLNFLKLLIPKLNGNIK